MNKYKLKNITHHNALNLHIETTINSGRFEIHNHDYCELVFIVSGKGTHIIGDMEYELKCGDIFILKGSEKHGFSSLEELRLFNIMFDLYSLHLEDCKEIPGFWVLFLQEQTSDFLSHMNVSGEDYNLLLSWCTQLLNEYTSKNPGHFAICHSLLVQLIVYLSRKFQNAYQISHQMNFHLARSIVYMQINFSDKINVEQLAEMEGFSKRHYTRLFHQIYGISPIQFLNELRLNHAKNLLEIGDYKVTEVASLCGFQDGNYFSRCFKKRYRRPPSEWK